MLCNWNLSNNYVAICLCCELLYMQALFTCAVSGAVSIKTGGVSWTLESEVGFLEFVRRQKTFFFFYSSPISNDHFMSI